MAASNRQQAGKPRGEEDGSKQQATSNRQASHEEKKMAASYRQ
jgi:hypothetical protein